MKKLNNAGLKKSVVYKKSIFYLAPVDEYFFYYYFTSIYFFYLDVSNDSHILHINTY